MSYGSYQGPGQGYGNGYGQQPGGSYYGAPQGQPPYGYPTPYGQPPAPRSPMLGLFSFILLVGAMVVGTVWTFFSYPEMNAWQEAGQPDSGLTGSLIAYALGCVVLWVVGVVTFILGIIATATGRGRLWGILSIVLSVLAPFLTLGIGAAASGGL